MPESSPSLRVRRLPGALTPDAVRALLEHFGAERVLPDRRPDVSSGREPGGGQGERTQAATARFASQEALRHALQRLQGLELAGHALEVAVVEQEKPAPKPSQARDFQPPLPKGDPPPLPKEDPPPVNESTAAGSSAAYAPVPLAPHLGLHFAPSPLLEYKYPRATEGIVRNMANALMALPKLYTQVLHLMNKMNLPLPFEDDAIPGVFSGDREDRADRKRSRPAEPPLTPQIVEEDEEEEEEETEVAVETTVGSSPTARKRPRVGDSRRCNVAHKRPEGRATRAVGDAAQLSRAFQIAESSEREPVLPRPGVITEAEVRRRRRPSLDMAAKPAMQNYSRGAASSSVRVQNLAEAVDEADLRSIFAFVLPPEVDVMRMAVSVSTCDRAATVEYPTKELATAAINQLHGVELEGRPLVVSFHPGVNNEAAPPSAPASSSAWTVESLDASRLDHTALSEEKAMKNYVRGDRSSTLYVKNLAKSVQLDDLKLLFTAALPPDVSADEMSIRHFTEGRMKCQAFVAFPTEDAAERVLDKVHGVELQGKPLVVCFRKQPSSSASTATRAQQ